MLFRSEAVQVGSAMALAPHDFVFPSYREHGVQLARDLPVEVVMAYWRGLPNTDWDARRHRVFYAHDVGGVHFVFLTVWPDSAAREWMEADLARVAPTVPVIVFTHDEPDVEAKHFVNPNGRHDINAVDQFENLLVDRFADGPMIGVESLTEERAFEQFLREQRPDTE